MKGVKLTQSPLKLGERLTVTVDAKALGESGVAHHQGFVVFVPLGVPGDVAEVEIIEVKKKYAVGRIATLRTPSPDRVEPPCGIFGECGSCQWLNIGYEGQLKYKTKIVRDTLSRMGDVPVERVKEIIPSPVSLGYRGKAQQMLVFQNEKYELGFYAHHSHRVVDCESCPLQFGEMNQVFQVIRRAVEAVKPSIYTPPAVPLSSKKGDKGGKGIPVGLRYVVVRTSATHRDHVVMLVASQLDERYEQIADAIMAAGVGVKGIVLNVNPDYTNVIYGRTTLVLRGDPDMVERMMDLTFRVAPTSFFQANVAVASLMVQEVVKMVRQKKPAVLFDMYCGVGVIALACASEAGKVFGVDESPSSIQDAKRNRDANHIQNVSLFEGTMELVIPELVQKEKADLVVVDPPRKGCEERTLVALAKMGAPDFLYISCNPMTLARDARILAAHGYRVESVQPYDMFPQTHHIEALAHFQRVETPG